MKSKINKILLWCATAALITSNATADTLDMELGVSAEEEAGFLNDLDPNYGGFTWSDSFAVVNVDAYNDLWLNTTVLPSGDNFLLNEVGEELLTVDTNGLINLESAFFSGFTSENSLDSFFSSTSVTIEGFLDGVLQDSITYDLTAGFEFYNIGMSNINSFNIINHGGFGVWLLDDLTFSTASISVMEPSTLALCGLGLIGAGFVRRKI